MTKRRYHDAIQESTGIAMPTAEMEASNPLAADEVYVAATRRLRELTRGESKAFALLRKENAAYGFHRNMLGVRWIGLSVALLVLMSEGYSRSVIALSRPHFDEAALARAGGFSYATAGVCLILAFAWVAYFTEPSVRRIGFSYAERLFECAASLPTVTKSVSLKRGTTEARKK